jgi:hypothetical protein
MWKTHPIAGENRIRHPSNPPVLCVCVFVFRELRQVYGPFRRRKGLLWNSVRVNNVYDAFK